MVAFYKHDIVAWRRGTANLSDRAYRVYHVIVEQIMQNEGPITLHELSLAGLSNRSVRDFRAALKELADIGKVYVVGGMIHNGRAEIELLTIKENRENAAKGGRAKKVRGTFVESSIETQPRAPRECASNGQREIRELAIKPNKINDDLKAPLLSCIKPKRDREEEDISSLRSDSHPKPDKPVRTRNVYPIDFEEFWQKFPTDPNMSKPEAAKIWAKLPPDDRAMAQASIPAFVAYCHGNPDYRPVHACRYLSQRRFEGFSAQVKRFERERGVFVPHGSEAWKAWDAYGRRVNGRGYPTMERDGLKGWNFPSEFPEQRGIA